MNLQFGSNTCEKMHIGKHHYLNICPKLEVDSWKETMQDDKNGEKKSTQGCVHRKEGYERGC